MTELVKLLVEAGADVNAKNLPMQLPVILAVERGEVGLVRMMIGRKVDLNAPGRDSQAAALMNALDLAKDLGNREMIELLKAHGARTMNDVKLGLEPEAEKKP